MFVYCAVHLETGRVYVGKTCDFHFRYGTHLKAAANGKSRTHFHRALRKYGADAFSWHVLECFLNGDESAASTAEKRWIRFWESHKPENGFNMTFGGDGVKPTAEVREKMKLAQRLRFESETLAEKQQRIARHVTGAVSIRGTKNPSAKLSQEQLDYIKQCLLVKSDMKTCDSLAKEFGVSSKTIQRIKYGVTYVSQSTSS